MIKTQESHLIEVAQQFQEVLYDNGIKAKIFHVGNSQVQLVFEKPRKGVSIYKSDTPYINIVYKSKNEQVYIRLHNINDSKLESQIIKLWYLNILKKPQIGYQIYTDGSFKYYKAGYGAVVLFNGESLAEFSGHMYKQTNIEAELKAICEALRWCKARYVKKVEVLYDLKLVTDLLNEKAQPCKKSHISFISFINSMYMDIQWTELKENKYLYYWHKQAHDLAFQAIMKNGRNSRTLRNVYR